MSEKGKQYFFLLHAEHNKTTFLVQVYTETCRVVMLRVHAVYVFPFCPATEGAPVLEDVLFVDIPMTIKSFT